MTNDQQITTMSIFDAVRQPGGNGLASPSFQPAPDFLGVFSWQNVETNVEALIYDGEHMPHTKFKADFFRLIGRRRFVRRVLLKPAPLEVTAEALTADQRQLSIDVAIKFKVKDPVHVASLENPINELTNVAEGIISEYIRTRQLVELMADSGQTRSELLNKLVNSTSITQHYDIVEVLKALPSGDESLIEIARAQELAQAESSLLDAQGQNKMIEARYNAEITKGEAKIKDEFDERVHQRQMEQATLKGQMDLAKSAIETLGQVAASGIDPTPLAKDIIAKLANPARRDDSEGQQSQPRTREPSKITEGQHIQVQQERDMLESIKEGVQMLAYDIVTSGSKVMGAVIQMPTYEIVFTCNNEYPDSPPQIMIRFPDGRETNMDAAWVNGVTTSMAQSVLVIAAHVK
ncbi:MAG: hypothetical protein H6652_00395 [Ardenticatenaceae bacterium]|nr:hypothetical protein [Ardenticatenaceae bacterium]